MTTKQIKQYFIDVQIKFSINKNDSYDVDLYTGYFQCWCDGEFIYETKIKIYRNFTHDSYHLELLNLIDV